MNYKLIYKSINELKSCSTQYYSNPKLLEMHKQGDFYKKTKENIIECGLKNPLILQDENIVKIGNNRLFILQELYPHELYIVACILPLDKVPDFKKLKKELYIDDNDIYK